MSSIRILPDILSNRIAAGEVVERPASVVKELIENALDAGSTRIVVEAENGGRSLIRVSDNGSGMDHDDALLALERYATSKLFTDEDLFSIKTLGFRGEALPSIAAVSRFTIVTREQKAEAGTEIRVDGGKIVKVSAAGAPAGTLVTVKQLFFNTPARRKFLKTVGTEMGHIGDVVASVAIGRPDIGFKLRHNGKTIKAWPPAADAEMRVIDILGPDLQHGLFPVFLDDGPVSLSGWIVSPQETRSTTRGIFMFVNGRFVRDRVILQALQHGYGRRVMKGRYPVAVLSISLPYDRVDVNVHPAKNEVRFTDQKQVYAAVREMVAETLVRNDRPAWSPAREPAAASLKGKTVSEEAVSWKGGSGADRPAGDPEKIESVRQTHRSFPEARKPAKQHRPATGISERQFPRPQKVPMASENKPPLQERLWQVTAFSDLNIIGQFHNTYILGEVGDRLVAVDQHAAHERILFERLQKKTTGTPVPAQGLLVPEIIDLGYREAAVLKPMLSDLQSTGLEIEPFGGNSFAVKAVPAFLGGREIRPLIVELAEKAVVTGVSGRLAAVREQCLTVIACHGAIRANQALDYRQMKGLLEELDACGDPAHCPHGRPTWIEWRLSEVEKLFGRIN